MNSSLTFENFQVKFCDPLVFCSTASSCILNISHSEMLAIELDFRKVLRFMLIRFPSEKSRFAPQNIFSCDSRKARLVASLLRNLRRSFCFVWITHYSLRRERIMLSYSEIANQSDYLKHQDQ